MKESSSRSKVLPAKEVGGITKKSLTGAQTSTRSWLPLVLLLLGVLIFWAPLLTDGETTLHWDAIDYHLGAQSYFADEIKAGRLPIWTEYQFSGFPFLADPQVGAWYPLNWPFFLAGITEKTLAAELVLHALLAALGTFLLFRLWRDDPWAALAAGLFYALSGFFAAHASHIGMFQAAAWLPWLLWGLHRAVLGQSIWWAALTGLGSACMFLAGHFQTALYCFLALGLYALALRQWRPAARALAVIASATVLLTAVQWLPSLTLIGQSIRASQQYTSSTNAPLAPASLVTLLVPNFLGAVKGTYTGPPDITQFYFYAGIALLPLAFWGARQDHRLMMPALVLLVPCLWYALGPGGGLYLAIAQLPGFRNVRAPVHIWFVVGLALALLAGAGFAHIRQNWVRFALLAFTFADLCYWNSYANELPYLRTSYQAEYGQKLDQFERAVTANLPPLTRFHTPIVSPFLGPLTGPLLARTPVTYGYNPLALAGYSQYLEASKQDPMRLNVLGSALQINPQTGQLQRNASAEPRFVLQSGTVQVVNAETTHYRLRYDTVGSGRLRAAIPWYPGWEASVNGVPAAIEQVDGALMSIPVPAGTGEMQLSFHLPGLVAGVWLSAAGLLGTLVVLLMGWRREWDSNPR